jgi:hypothetical protein
LFARARKQSNPLAARAPRMAEPAGGAAAAAAVVAPLYELRADAPLYELRADAPLRPPRCPASEVRPGAIIVVDNGSYQCRAGWAGQPAPRVVFRALLHRPRAKVRCRARCVCIDTRRRKPSPRCAVALTGAANACVRAQSLPDGASIVGDYDASLLRGVDPTRSSVRCARTSTARSLRFWRTHICVGVPRAHHVRRCRNTLPVRAAALRASLVTTRRQRSQRPSTRLTRADALG